MAITYVAHNTGLVFSTTTDPITIAAEPTGTVNGDLVICSLFYRGTMKFTAPSGWTLLTETSVTPNTNINLTTAITGAQVFYTFRGSAALGTAGQPVLVFPRDSTGTASLAGARLISIRGTDPSNPFRQYAVDSIQATSNVLYASTTTYTALEGDGLLMLNHVSRTSGSSGWQVNTGTPITVTERDDDSTTTDPDGALAHAFITLGSGQGFTGQTLSVQTASGGRHALAGLVIKPPGASPKRRIIISL